MAKKRAGGYMTDGEKLAGTLFFVIYLAVLPFVTDRLFDLIATLLGAVISAGLRSTLYYYTLFAVTVVIFHGFLSRTSRNFGEDPARACKAVLVGLVALYGLNELAYRLTNLLTVNRTNLNDMTISAQIDSAPRTTILIVVALAPFVEEVLFRGLVFGCLRGKSRLLAYLVSCALFAFLHVWQFALGSQDATYFLLMAQYLVPGVVLAWSYDYAGTLWASVGLHAAANALSLLTMLN